MRFPACPSLWGPNTLELSLTMVINDTTMLIYSIIICFTIVAAKRIPGVIYGVHNEEPFKQTITLLQNDALKQWRQLGASLENTLFNVKLEDNRTYLVTPRQLQVHQGIYIVW